MKRNTFGIFSFRKNKQGLDKPESREPKPLKRYELKKSYWPQTPDGSIISKIEVLRPKPSPKPLIRIGGTEDGAYLLPDDLSGIKACFSPGVNNKKTFEDELSEKYDIECHMCDYSSNIEKFKTPLNTKQNFKKKWLSPEPNSDSITLSEWVTELAPQPDTDLILQMDIEGAEYLNLLDTPNEILQRFRIVIIELHNLQACNHPEDFDDSLGPTLELLDKHFVCVHAHPNNCCGDFILQHSELNIPNVVEVTFLRRDRWAEVAQENWHAPLIPHPLDIFANSPTKEPLFLNEHWIADKERAPESKIKMLTDQVGYLTLALARARGSSLRPEVADELYQLAQYTAFSLPTLQMKPPADKLVDLSKDKPFVLSSRHDASPKENIIRETKPYFFHTGRGRHQFITIDLQAEHRLFELRIKNRTDMCKDRARFLFYNAHHEAVLKDLKGFPVAVDSNFLTKANAVSATDLRGCQARYLTIFSAEETFLHLSMIQILGFRVD
ncbi:MAG: hypothetical protein K9L82_03545 [Chromatiaceae bacterium]|nr:hypothetical protein [Chromatiaceae bacterium]MCF7994837.1 hypothetical protein [Chromatiaceae bacterium]